MTKTRQILITDWSVRSCQHQASPFTPPGSLTVLHGKVFNHPNFPAGADAATSIVLSFDSRTRKCVTQNSLYRLGFMSKVFKQWMREHDLTISSYDTENNASGTNRAA